MFIDKFIKSIFGDMCINRAETAMVTTPIAVSGPITTDTTNYIIK